MITYVAFLRGINVSGHNLIKMELLKSIFESLGFTNISTYLQSGNVTFSHLSADTPMLERNIREKIFTAAGLKVPVVVRTRHQLKDVITRNPFYQRETCLEHLCVTFLSGHPAVKLEDAAGQINYTPDEFVHLDREVYLFCPSGYGKTKLSNQFIEKKLQVTATTRNWKTINKLVEIME
jgi:uncharacterized protein (DUF1697 family)